MPTTPNFGWVLPTVGGDTGVWGTLANQAFTDIDTDLNTVDGKADTALGYPLGVLQFWANGSPTTSSQTYKVSTSVLTPQDPSTGINWLQAIPLAVDQAIASVTARVYRDSGATVTLDVYRVADDGMRTQIGSTATSASTGWHDLTVTQAHTVLTANRYFIEMTLLANSSSSASARYQGYVVV